MNPFDIVASVSHTKKRAIDETNESEYNAFMVNRALSYYPDTIMHAQDMNVNHHLSGLLQYDYFFSSLRPRKRFSKWFKRERDEQVEAVMREYSYNRQRAEEAVSLMNKKQLADLVDSQTRGHDQ
jgi:Bacteriophage clamp loader A subunit